MLRKIECWSTLSNKFWLCCSFFIKLTTCHATNAAIVDPRQANQPISALHFFNPQQMFSLRKKLIAQGEKRETSTKTCIETTLHDKLRVFVSRISPPLSIRSKLNFRLTGRGLHLPVFSLHRFLARVAMSNHWASYKNYILRMIERFSNDCRKTKTEIITLTNHNRGKQRDKPMKIYFSDQSEQERGCAINQSEFLAISRKLLKAREKTNGTDCDWFWFCRKTGERQSLTVAIAIALLLSTVIYNLLNI